MGTNLSVVSHVIAPTERVGYNGIFETKKGDGSIKRVGTAAFLNQKKKLNQPKDLHQIYGWIQKLGLVVHSSTHNSKILEYLLSYDTIKIRPVRWYCVESYTKPSIYKALTWICNNHVREN